LTVAAYGVSLVPLPGLNGFDDTNPLHALHASLTVPDPLFIRCTMNRLVLLVCARVLGCAVEVAAEQTPARWAASKNVRMFFDDDVLKAATAEIDLAYRYEVEAVARVIADCDGAQMLSILPEACSRSVNYFLVVIAKSDGALPRLILAMNSAARETRPQDTDQLDNDQKRALARWVKVQGALANAARSRLLELAKEGH
jgi:hypothetical protein